MILAVVDIVVNHAVFTGLRYRIDFGQCLGRGDIQAGKVGNGLRQRNRLRFIAQNGCEDDLGIIMILPASKQRRPRRSIDKAASTRI